jgi:hypothetical protein
MRCCSMGSDRLYSVPDVDSSVKSLKCSAHLIIDNVANAKKRGCEREEEGLGSESLS